ncbi:nitrate- and nitrite sensing domain-containing protein [Halomonas sp. G15]|uniref:nitrate- and nitrite sensing domain-containing protein n=1 Tax=Halomonas sp. G15 TaxID=2903521 RepID=UPI001E501444|nr:nitrate- and nitrite sensing domain-containing protein [Halomonas sp. G15]MCE0731962.1 nitrate- and nitrite sensing domain-containing protein [Halomonas sp. G15]
MTKLLNRIPMGWKFVLALALPLLAMTWFAVNGILERQHMATNMAELEQLTRLSQGAGNLVHQLQRERGISSGYIGSNGETFGSRLNSQRPATDQALSAFQATLSELDLAALSPDLAAMAGDVESHLAETRALRRRIEALEVEAQEAVDHFTGFNETLIGMVGEMAHLTDDAEISRRLGAYYTLLKAKDLAGIERAVLANAFSTNLMRTPMHQRLLAMQGQEGAHFETFDTLANAKMSDSLNAILEGDIVQRVTPCGRRP